MKKELVKIRKINKNDLSQLKKLYLEAHKEVAKFSDDIIVNKQTEKEVNQEAGKDFKDSFTTVFVAEKDGKIIGNVGISFTPGLRKEGAIFNLFVIKSQRRKGIGSKLMKASIKWLKKKGIKTTRIIVHRKNRTGLSFLRRFNFKKEPIKVFWLNKSI